MEKKPELVSQTKKDENKVGDIPKELNPKLIQAIKFLRENDNKIKTTAYETVHNTLNKLQNESNGLITLSGGNSVQVAQYLALYSNRDIITYQLFVYMIEHYWTNLWYIEGETESEKKIIRIWKNIMVILFRYGTGIVKRTKNGFIALGTVVYEVDINQEIVKAEGFINNITFIGSAYAEKYSEIHKVVGIDNKNAVFGKWNFIGASNFWTYLPFLSKVRDHFLSYYANLIGNTVKFKYTVKNLDDQLILNELRSYFDLRNNLIIKYKNEGIANGGQENDFEVVDKKENQSSVLNDLKVFLDTWFTIYGIRSSGQNFKKERNISAEFEQQNLNYLLKEAEIEEQLTFFVERINEKFEMNLKLRSRVREHKIKEAELEKIKIGANHG